MQGDALRVFQVLKSGGTAICPADVGYAIMTCNPRALEKVFNTKKRGSHKRHAMIGSYAIHRSLHTMSPEHAEIVTSLTQDFDLPLGVIGKYKPEHELIKGLDDLTMEASSVGGTISVLVNAGKFQDELTKLTAEAALPLLGSSANLSGTGLLIDRH
jgi:tRNA A37 threonylcarbamoyladenosine synthetase subunit TsaC/SUA5/YrdC